MEYILLICLIILLIYNMFPTEEEDALKASVWQIIRSKRLDEDIRLFKGSSYDETVSYNIFSQTWDRLMADGKLKGQSASELAFTVMHQVALEQLERRAEQEEGMDWFGIF